MIRFWNGWKTGPALCLALALTPPAGSPVQTTAGAPAQTPPAQKTTTPMPTLKIALRLDALKKDPQGNKDCAALLQKLQARAGSDAPDLSAWSGLAEGSPLHFKILPEAIPDVLQVLAARTASETDLCLYNTSQNPLKVYLETILPAGLYSIKLLTLPSPPETADSSAPVVFPEPELKRLQGILLRRNKMVVRSLSLNPGEALFVRFTDEAHALRESYHKALQTLHELAAHRSGAADRLRNMLEGEQDSVQKLSSQWAERNSRLDALHHLLLITGRAQTLCQNYCVRGVVPQDMADKTANSFHLLMEGFARCGAALMELAPQMTILPASPDDAHSRKIVLSLANGGGNTIGLVKLGLRPPQGTHCSPSDDAVFSGLEPGQTVAASFKIRADAAPFPTQNCTAVFSYVVEGRPTRFQIHPW